MSTQKEKIEKAREKAWSAIADLRRLYNHYETSLNEMDKIMDIAREFDVLDFTKTITE